MLCNHSVHLGIQEAGPVNSISVYMWKDGITPLGPVYNWCRPIPGPGTIGRNSVRRASFPLGGEIEERVKGWGGGRVIMFAQRTMFRQGG